MAIKRSDIPRHLIVNDHSGRWFIRHVRVVEHDMDRDEKVYRCDVPAGGPYDDLPSAVQAFQLMMASA